MTLRHVGVWGILFLLPSSVLNASTLVIRDSIGADSSLTDGMPGGVTLHDGSDWNTPGLVVNVPEDGKLTEARFVIFARGPDQRFLRKTIWPISTAIPWSFTFGRMASKAELIRLMRIRKGNLVPGHIDIDVNTPTTRALSQ